MDSTVRTCADQASMQDRGFTSSCISVAMIGSHDRGFDDI